MQIFPHSKFGINRTTGSKVMAKKLLGQNFNFLAITFEPAVLFIPNFECRKICMFLSLFAKSVLPWGQQPGTLFTAGTKRSPITRIKKYYSSSVPFHKFQNGSRSFKILLQFHQIQPKYPFRSAPSVHEWNLFCSVPAEKWNCSVMN